MPFSAVGFSFLEKLGHITEAPFCIGKQNQKRRKDSFKVRQSAMVGSSYFLADDKMQNSSILPRRNKETLY